MKAQRVARELALLSMSQLSSNLEKLSAQQLSDLVLAAVRALTNEVHDILETAAAELKRSNDRLLGSEIQATTVQSSRTMVYEAVELTQTAINRVAMAMELPEFLQLTNQKEVKAYTLETLTLVNAHREEIDAILQQAIVNWQLNRIARIDRDILRIAVAEMRYLGLQERIAINEAVELAKRYSGEDGYRFVNGVLRRVTEQFHETVPQE
ncbi:transcription antitermination factor NusB [Laspinema olomoucense]|uniref:Transcription antitermination protein NusB n=1 Tax=Laspinema olomoucense D3b TaxID=2953688 RepID=A0ABT2NA59_9CYAN|nr:MULTISPECIES: transcription antitermination factor NusB [unclassified Laspinema]MCT7974480.1 transcription antitermination factor NusB [Laspinema sp. D3d]MCT7979584.1 transcription antitermination factor NusB [Laspinema sp. D3b]MCT7989604.1 transcription antitermination factor NusB [Laspinema sp. D3a]MCT7997242.1 transcription antitermination factor NusB [Laspinema sp. D3c]